jgi:hypothetical protein
MQKWHGSAIVSVIVFKPLPKRLASRTQRAANECGIIHYLIPRGRLSPARAIRCPD